MSTYEITTECINTRSKSRRIRTWTIEAESIDEACYQARMSHVQVVGWNSSIACSVKGYATDIETGQWVEDYGQKGALR